MSLNLHVNSSLHQTTEMTTPLSSLPQNSTSLNLHVNSRSPTLDAAIDHEMQHGRRTLDPNMDPKKFRRTISNRVSARKSRLRSAKYAHDLEENVKDLQELISILSSQVRKHEERNQSMHLENDSLQQELEKQSNESRLREIELEEKKDEIKRLKEELEKDQMMRCKNQQSPCAEVIQPGLAPDHSINEHSVNNQNEPPTVEDSEMNPVPDEDIEQYLNLDALHSNPFICEL